MRKKCKSEDKEGSHCTQVVAWQSEGTVSSVLGGWIPYAKILHCMRNLLRFTGLSPYRLCPIVPGNARFIQEDLVLSGYKVPSGVSLFGQHKSYDGVHPFQVVFPVLPYNLRLRHEIAFLMPENDDPKFPCFAQPQSVDAQSTS